MLERKSFSCKLAVYGPFVFFFLIAALPGHAQTVTISGAGETAKLNERLHSIRLNVS